MRSLKGTLHQSCAFCVALTGLISVGFAFTQDKPLPTAKAHIERVNARNSLKHATDRDASRISRKPTPTTIAAVLKVQRPSVLDDAKIKPTARRLSAFEKTVWVMDVKIVSVVKREDGDYYFVLEDGQGRQTVAE